MSNIDNILRAAMIAAAVVNLISCVHYIIKIRKPDRLTAAMQTWTEENPRSNFGAYIIKKYPTGNMRQIEALEEYAEWKRETEVDLPIELLNDHYLLEAIALGKPETPPDES